ncbi:MAG TPA: tetratricopeptide repeat protein [Terriglobales bacterium]|nr:tetratricopeptide repeat protein [Terriglobales bacterium]
MQSYTRHQLKEDKFQEVTRGAIAQAQAHRQFLTLAGVAVLVAVIVLGGFGYWRNQQDEQASAAVGQAMNTYAAPIRTPGAPVDATQVSYATTAERDKEAERQFQAIADKYPHTDSGKNALYMTGVVALDAGDYATAEAKFKKAADVGNKEIASLAKMGLAAVSEATNRDQDAINIYNELMKKPTESVSRERAQFALASLYERKDPAQAKKIYDQLASDKSPAVAQIAKQRQGELK